jgi:hypothetical protein
LAVEEFFQLFLQISGSTVLFRRFEGNSWSARNIFGIHPRTQQGAGIVERKRVPGEGDLLGGNSRAALQTST